MKSWKDTHYSIKNLQHFIHQYRPTVMILLTCYRWLLKRGEGIEKIDANSEGGYLFLM